MSDETTSTQDRASSSGTGVDRTQRLMTWSTIGGFVGLVLSIATLAFTIFFSQILRKQAEVVAPAAKMAARMDSDISRTIGALRGWVAYGDPRFKEERRGRWVEIEENYETFRAAVASQIGAKQRAGLDEFRKHLNELKYVQWAIEDVAHSPGNESAQQDWDRNVVPVRNSMLRAFFRGAAASGTQVRVRPQLFFVTVLFYSQFLATDSRLQAYVRDPSVVSLQNYEQAAVEMNSRATLLAPMLTEDNAKAAPAIYAMASFTSKEWLAYERRANELVAARRQKDGTAAEALFRYRALPLANFVSSRMRFISTVQAEVSTKSAKLFNILGLIVVAGALLIGIMSLSTLYVSFRIRSRVARVIDRAKKLGQYQIERKLGEGGMGEVYLARHAMLRRPAAIKLLREDRGISKRAKERFRSEVQLTSRLSHPNTVQIFDYGVTPDGVFYYAMEYLDGATLQQIVERTGPMPSSRVVHVLRQMAGSLEEAHGLGLLHRDVKPANVMLCRLGGIWDTAKVLDFGLVEELSDHSSEADGNRLEGTPMYIAPETILEAGGSEERSDLYAVGAVGYFLLVGAPPFEGDDVVDILAKHLTEKPAHPSERADDAVDATLEQILLDCLRKDPEARPASARDLRARLEACEVGAEWTEDARITWWTEFGEVIEAATAEGRSTPGSSLGSGLAVKIGSTRGATRS